MTETITAPARGRAQSIRYWKVTALRRSRELRTGVPFAGAISVIVGAVACLVPAAPGSGPTTVSVRNEEE